MQMPTQSAGDSYMNSYYQTMNSMMNYPSNYFTDPNNWGSNGTDSYLNGYGQEYMQFASGFDYGPAFGFNWPTYDDYSSSWGAAPQQQMDNMKLDGQQANMMGQVYNDYSSYPTSTSSGTVAAASVISQQRTGVYVNGSDILPPTSNNVESVSTSELELGMNMVSLNGTSEVSQESPSDTSVHENPTNVNNSSSKAPSHSSGPSKPMSWANVASQPAKPAPKPPVAPVTYHKRDMTKPSAVDYANTEAASKNQTSNNSQRNAWSAPRNHRTTGSTSVSNGGAATSANSSPQPKTSETGEVDPTLNKLKQTNNYNPKTFDLNAKNARFFVIKSYSEDDIHRAIKYGVWCSTEHGNKRLDAAFKEREGKGPIFLFFSVNGSGHFCGMAQMMSGVDYQTHAGVWTQDKWKGTMEIKWIYVKDVPNNQLRHIRLENNENKPVTNSRDTQEVPHDKGKQVLKIIHTFRHSTSIFDDFGHYEKKEEEEGGDSKRKLAVSNRSSYNVMVLFLLTKAEPSSMPLYISLFQISHF